MATTTKTEFDMTSPIAVATLPMREEAIASATAYANSMIELVQSWLDSGYRPQYPKNLSGSASARARYKKYEAEKALLFALIGTNEYYRATEVNSEKVAIYIAKCQELGIKNWQSFVNKLIGKTSDVADARLVSNVGVWSYNILEITKTDGTVEKWKTQTIVNCSCLGTYFNQYPTRLMK
jgi:hypothetical protein